MFRHIQHITSSQLKGVYTSGSTFYMFTYMGGFDTIVKLDWRFKECEAMAIKYHS